jgi:nucleoside-diphosphate-sugar epimerase
MRVVVTGASGNVGTSVLRSLARDPDVHSIVGLARRRPSLELPRTAWVAGDIREANLEEIFAGADAVIHLAWLIQPSRDETVTYTVNVTGSARVFAAAATAGVSTLVYASSVGAYGPGPKDRAVDESWPTTGIGSLFYSRHKAIVERMLDTFEAEHPEMRVVRLRPGLIFKADAASEIRRLFVGPFLPSWMLRRALIPFVPSLPGLRFQAVHSHDVGEAYRLALKTNVRGAFNIAANPVIDVTVLASLLEARPLKLPAGLLRALTDLTWRARLQPSPPGWLDLALGVAIMDTSRAREELGWIPAHSSTAALEELLEGMRAKAGMSTPPLEPKRGGPLPFELHRPG